METRKIVCGGVAFNDYGFFKSQKDRLITYFENIRLSGHARGADTFAEQYAVEKDIQI